MDTSASAASLASVYAGWEEDRRLISTSLMPLTDEELALRAAPHLRSIGHLAAHIIAARARMMHWILGEGTGEGEGEGEGGLDGLCRWDGFDRPAPSEIRPPSELVHGLEMTGQAIQRALNRWTLGDLDQTVEWSFGDATHTFTRQRVIWNLVRHDYLHFGELALTLGLYGLPGPDF